MYFYSDVPSLTLFSLDLKKPNDKALAFILPIAILFGLYLLYRKWTEKKLLNVKTTLSRSKNKEILLTFLEQKGFCVFLQSKEVIIAHSEEELSFNGLWTKTLTFIVTDHRIYFNIVKNYPKVNPPVLFSHMLLKHDLKKFITGRQTNPQPLKDEYEIG